MSMKADTESGIYHGVRWRKRKVYMPLIDSDCMRYQPMIDGRAVCRFFETFGGFVRWVDEVGVQL